MSPLTLWAVTDPDNEKGRQFLYDSINFYVIKNFHYKKKLKN